jgi:hypothetical protein
MRVKMGPEFFPLFKTDAAVHDNFSISGLNQQTSHAPRAHIIGIGGIQMIPNAFWYHPKHRTSI